MDSLLDNGDQPAIDENKDYFAELVGEGKKFKDEKELAKGKAYSDAHIQVLESRFDTLSEDHRKALDELRARASLEELITKLETKQQQPSSREENPNSNEEKIQPAKGLDEAQLDSILDSKLTKREQERKERENFAKVQAILKDKLGSNYKNILREKSEALGLTDEEVTSMAKRNPNLFSKTFDLDARPQGESFQTPPRNSPTFTPKGAQKRGWSYYQELKKKDPQAWMQPKIAIQMEKDAQEMGMEAFYAS